MTELTNHNCILHLRFDGRSYEMPLDALDLDLQTSDEQIIRAVASHLDRSPTDLDGYVVVRHEQTIVVRPEAIYG